MASDYKMIRQSGSAAVVEYTDKNGMLRRVTIPSDAVTEEGIAPELLAAGVPQGLDGEAVIAKACNPERVANALRKAGLWTLRDARGAPMKVAKVLAQQMPRVNDLLAIIEKMEGKK